MAKFGGIALKSIALFIRIIQFGCAASILGIYSYFLASLSNHKLGINVHIRATEGISGVAVIYTIVGFLFVCCLGGVTFFGYLSILLDFAFAGAFAYVAWVNRHGASSCNGIVTTPYGQGAADNRNSAAADERFTHLPSFRTACRMETAAFSVALIGCLFFLLSIPLSLGLVKHHRKEKAFGPSPKNNYTAGSPRRRRFWQKKNRTADPEFGMTGAKTHPDTLPTHASPNDMRTSYATDTTAVGEGGVGYNKHASGNPHVPVGTAVNNGQYAGRNTAGNF